MRWDDVLADCFTCRHDHVLTWLARTNSGGFFLGEGVSFFLTMIECDCDGLDGE